MEISVDESAILISQRDGDHYSSDGDLTDKFDETGEAADPFDDELGGGPFDMSFQTLKGQQGLNKEDFPQVDHKDSSEDHLGEISEPESELERRNTNSDPRNATLKRPLFVRIDGETSRKRQRTRGSSTYTVHRHLHSRIAHNRRTQLPRT